MNRECLPAALRAVISGEAAIPRVHVSSVLRKLRVKDRQTAFEALRDE